MLKFLKNNISSLVLCGAIIFALLSALILPGIIRVDGVYTYTASVFSLMLGYVHIVTKKLPAGEQIPVYSEKTGTGGMSTFGFISFILLCVAIVLLVVYFCTKIKYFDLISAFFTIISGIFIFFLLESGTDIVEKYSHSFFYTYFYYTLSSGAILYGIFTIVGGTFAILYKFKSFFAKIKLSSLVPLFASALAIVALFFLPGLVKNEYGHTDYAPLYTFSVNMLGVIFGNAHTIFATRHHFDGRIVGFNYEKLQVDGGASYFGILSFILLVVGMGFIVFSLFSKKTKFELVGSICIAVSSLLIFSISADGTAILSAPSFRYGSSEYTFSAFYGNCRFGAGTIVYAIATMLASTFGIFNSAIKMQTKAVPPSKTVS